MKLTKWIGALLIGASLLMAGCSSEPPKAGTIDFERVLSESKVGVETEAKMKAQIEALQEEMKKEEAPKSQEEFMKKQQEFQQRAQASQQQVAREFRATLEKAASEVAQSKKMGIVLEKNQVVTGSIDITDDVIAKMGGKVEKKEEDKAGAEKGAAPKQ